MTNSLEDAMRCMVASMENEQNTQEQGIPEPTGQEPRPGETIHIHYFPDAIVICKEEEEAQVVDSPSGVPRKTSLFPAYVICCFYLLLIVFTLAFQVYALLNPPIATVTIVPTSQTLTMTGTVQLGRVLPPLTISQSQTTATTGTVHQAARAATGTVAFYNGQFQAVTIAAGTILTGASGRAVVTDQDAVIPAGNPPSYGHVSISAHAVRPGASGNIPAYDINHACCAPSVLAKNSTPFMGGQDERTFQTVEASDIARAATPLKTAAAQSMQAALHGQLQPSEQLHLLSCTPTVTSDHQAGHEATTVNVTVSETCSAVAYNSQTLTEKVTAILSSLAATKLGTGYSLLGAVQVSVTRATIMQTAHPLVFVSVQAQGTWVYALGRAEQQQIKTLIAGKTTHGALQLLMSLPGVEQASLRFSGFGDAARLPKNIQNIHLVLLVL